jgi:erythromycin esterase-like protein
MGDVAARLRKQVTPFADEHALVSEVVQTVGDARYVLLGEASHGTHEFYALRAELTKRLIRDKGFSVVAVEADWPDASRVNRYVRGEGADRDAREALSDFARFPRWMWRNAVVRDFVTWLREHNDGVQRKVGLYGLDLYSLHSSIRSVLHYLEGSDPEGAQEARARYGCFESFGGDPQRYGYLASFGRASCEDAVVAQLTQLRARRATLTATGDVAAHDALFFAEQNARVVKNAERYYRTMYRGGSASWNLRDTHMADTVDALCAHFGARDRQTKIVVWAHNSHLGDARATELGEQGQLNLGQLLRERHGGQTYLLGFSTYEGEVTAASDWDAEAERKRVRPALARSHEALFHALQLPQFFVRCDPALAALLHEPLLERAIGVVYRPQTERASHYFGARIAAQFDAVIHIDRTHALEPLDGHARREAAEPPETYPTGL